MARVSGGNAEKIKKYFGGAGRVLPWILILVGVPLIFAAGVGLLLIGAGVFMLSRQSAPVEDSKIDVWTGEIIALHDYVARAKEISGFTNLVREPILLTGFASDSLKSNVFSGTRVGDDGIIRETPMSATVLLATDEQMGVYRTGIDLITGNRVNENFLEVFYQDVTAVTVGSLSDFLDLGLAVRTPAQGVNIQQSLDAAKRRKEATKLRARFGRSIVADILQWERAKLYRFDFSDGEHVSIVVQDSRITEEANASQFVEGDSTAQAMHSFRTFVRDKKRGFLRKEIAG